MLDAEKKYTKELKRIRQSFECYRSQLNQVYVKRFADASGKIAKENVASNIEVSESKRLNRPKSAAISKVEAAPQK